MGKFQLKTVSSCRYYKIPKLSQYFHQERRIRLARWRLDVPTASLAATFANGQPQPAENRGNEWGGWRKGWSVIGGGGGLYEAGWGWDLGG